MIREWLRRRRAKKRQAKCVHDYRVLCEYVDYDFYMKMTDVVAIYCPKCNEEKRITKSDWRVFLMKKHVYDKYHSEEKRSEDRK